MIESLKTAQRFSGNRALLSKNLTKKRLDIIWNLWQDKAKLRGQNVEVRPERGKVLITIRRAVNLPELHYTRDVQVYCSIVLHSAYRITSLHPPSRNPGKFVCAGGVRLCV
jgi:hypothetical protein